MILFSLLELMRDELPCRRRTNVVVAAEPLRSSARVRQWYADPYRIDFEFAAETIKKA